MTIIFVTVLAVIWILVGVVCWIFWRAKKREDAAASAGTGASGPPKENRREWRSVRSS